MDFIEATLPYPPTVNKYWITRIIRGKKIVTRTERVKKYIRDVGYLMLMKRNPSLKEKLLRLEVSVYPPDNKKRDLDNLLKVICDSLQAAGVYEDDFQIWQLCIQRCIVVRGGEVKIKLSERKI